MVAVTCTRCGKAAEGADVPTRGLYMCLACQLVTDPTAPPPLDYKPTRRAKWPWLVIAALVLGGGITAWVYRSRKQARDMVAMRYPIAATADEAQLLKQEAAKWRRGKTALLATLRELEPAPAAATTKPCRLLIELPVEGSYDKSASMDDKLERASHRDPDESLVLAHVFKSDLPGRVEHQLATLLETADRARFHSVRGRHLAIAATTLPLIVMVLEENASPGLTTQDMMVSGANLGSRKAFVQGHRVGTAYVFDKETGKLACAGRFEASSSESVMTVQSDWGYGTEQDAVEIDFENNTVKAIAAAVHAVE